MASLPSPTTSPPTMPLSVPDRPADAINSVQGRVPSQHTANSRDLLSSPRNPSSSSQLASPRYVHQYRALMDDQRKVFDKERDLWQTERSDLLDEISRLRAKLRQVEGSSSNRIISPTGRHESGTSFLGFSGFSSTSSSRHTSTGDEFWRGAGGKSDAQPTRTFSDPPNQPSTIGDRLPSISENESPRARRSLLTDCISGANKTRNPSIHAGADIDGVTFRSNSSASSSGPNIISPQSPSPLRTSPGSLPAPASQPGIPIDCNTRHAGHTPLARGFRYDTDGSASAISSSPTTPTQPEVERLPHEPRASFVRPPRERSDSYFSGVSTNTNEDPQLNEPLGLGDRNPSETQSFLAAVDSRLTEVVNSEDEQAGKFAEGSRNDNGSAPQQSASETSYAEPKLRIKRSMNFGSQFGSLR
jgi:hypothetical protein